MTTLAPPSLARPRTLLVLLAFVAFISLGLPDGVLGVAWPSMRHTFNRPFDNVGLLLFSGMAAYMASSFFAGQIIRVLGVGKLLALSCALVTLALGGSALAPAWSWLIVFAFIGGLGAGAIDAGINTFAATHFSTRTMNWLHAFWGIGATTGPILITFLLTMQLSWRVGYGTLAVLLALLTALFIITHKSWSNGPATTPAHHATAPVSHALRHPTVWLHILIYCVDGGIESTGGQLLFTLFTESRGLSIQAAGVAVACYWAALTLGRMVFGQLAAFIRPQSVLLISTLLSPLAALLIWWHPTEFLGLAGGVLLGFAIAPIFPTYIAITPNRVGPAIAPHAIGFQVAAACVGVMIFPGAVAALTRYFGLEIISLFLVLATLVLLGLHLLAQRIAR